MAENNSLTLDEEISLATDFLSAEELEDDSVVVNKKVKVIKEDSEQDDAEEPKMTDKGWSDFVSSKFEEDELDPDGRPLVHGLRRVVRLLLGPIKESKVKVVQAPSLLNGFEKLGFLQPACVEYTVKILMCRTDSDNIPAYEAEFTDAADVYTGNSDSDFARHSTATAATRAEARCLRKLLQLKGIASEEKTLVPSIEAALDGNITPESINFINQLSRRQNINVMKFINSGKKKYNKIDDVEAGVAAKMVEHLSNLEGSGKIPPEILGYDPKWNKG